ncbi:hypothetical protein EYM_04080 [Ignicoccus islandicus DSM 13165]|uniref:Uncharacterized protein n=1 Tax=Ignicoccus islandicus DSM 13165 TaxID=940295 RepID=A0A0U3FQ78_9CREN|nr:hypothetical protein EYM_04080 [Ignicoccus islandicus DSM 13165]
MNYNKFLVSLVIAGLISTVIGYGLLGYYFALNVFISSLSFALALIVSTFVVEVICNWSGYC